MTLADAYKALTRKVSIEAEPPLSTDEVTDILNANVRGTVWAASTAYSFGDKIVPTVGNGRLYRCIDAGTSGTTEPTWGTTVYGSITPGNQIVWSVTSIGQIVADNDIAWIDDGPAPANLYDLTGAAHDVCILKASKASGDVDAKDASQNISNSQYKKHWTQQANRFIRNSRVY